MAFIKRGIMYYNKYYNINIYLDNQCNNDLKENLIVIKNIMF
jgi:hypothetical protein